jgi:D-sedoheptulose 7-phosphate isomerase
MEFTEQIDSYLGKLTRTLERLDRHEVSKFAELLLAAYEGGRKVLVFGNGGSATTASHFACDINKGVSYGLEKRFRILPLTDNMATMMAYANDVSYEDIFVEQAKNFLEPGDLVVGISGSGNSKNVLKAIEYAKQKGNTTVGICGYMGGKLRQISDHSVNANFNDMQISEDVHFIVMHLMMKITSKSITGMEVRC